MPRLRSGKVSQNLNKLETQISKHQNKGKASVQKVVQPLADQIPSDLLGAGSIWSSNVDSASIWIWIGPSN